MTKKDLFSNFSIDNLPFGIFSLPNQNPRVGMAYKDRVIDLYALAQKGWWDIDIEVLQQPHLNDFIALGKSVTQKIRSDVKNLINNIHSKYIKNISVSIHAVTMHLPIRIGDYTDFYSSLEHATNVGKLFRDPKQALLPNWKHLPVAYHGRASSIIPSGAKVHRPLGQIVKSKRQNPEFKVTEKLDFELEMGCIIGKENALGRPIPIDEAHSYIFGLVLCNDWSARDIQQWEYVPLGPFLGKNFATSISPWVIPIEALEPFKVPAPKQDPPVLEYLQSKERWNYDIQLEVWLQTKAGQKHKICRSNTKYLYWTLEQQIAHHSSNGCPLRIGDLLASGTISGKKPQSYGSLLELTKNGSAPLKFKNDEERIFIEDGDQIRFTATAKKDNCSLGFGTLENTVNPTI